MDNIFYFTKKNLEYLYSSTTLVVQINYKSVIDL